MTTAFLYDGVRTPFGRFNGALAGVRPDDLAATTLAALLARHHHIVEALFKAFARAIDAACQHDPRISNLLPSTKGKL